MEGVQKLVKKELKEVLKQHGFKTRKFNFYREVNGVVQGFKIYANGHYTIRYDMFPLVCGINYDNYVFEGNEIANLTNPKRETFLHVIPYGESISEQDQIEAWVNRYEIYKNFAKQLVNEVYTYLLPIFDEYNIPSKYLEKGKWERYFTYEDCVYWCLQDRDFDKAKKYIEKVLKEESLINNEYRLKKLLLYKEYIDNNNLHEFEEYLSNNEKKTIESFNLKRRNKQ